VRTGRAARWGIAYLALIPAFGLAYRVLSSGNFYQVNLEQDRSVARAEDALLRALPLDGSVGRPNSGGGSSSSSWLGPLVYDDDNLRVVAAASLYCDSETSRRSEFVSADLILTQFAIDLELDAT
jgi:hypothetical protein